MTRTIRNILVLTLALSTTYGCNFSGEANIDVDCAINGFGHGKCTFTNRGTASGSTCGQVVLVRQSDHQTISSPTYCSGKIEQATSKQLEISIPKSQDFCEYNTCTYDWLNKSQVSD